MANKGLNVRNDNNKRVRIQSDSSSSEPENNNTTNTQAPLIQLDDPVLNKQQKLEDNLNSLTSTLQTIADNVTSLSRQNTPPPVEHSHSEYYDDNDIHDGPNDGYDSEYAEYNENDFMEDIADNQF